jgi:hypothetical protein
MGLEKIKGVYIGTFRERLDIEGIQQQIAIIKNRMLLREKAESSTQRIIDEQIDKMANNMQKEIDQQVIDSFRAGAYTIGSIPKSSEVVSTMSIIEYLNSLKA